MIEILIPMNKGLTRVHTKPIIAVKNVEDFLNSQFFVPYVIFGHANELQFLTKGFVGIVTREKLYVWLNLIVIYNDMNLISSFIR